MFEPRHHELQAGLAHQRRHNWEAAAACYQRAAVDEPVESRFLLGWLAFERGEYAQAHQAFAAVLAADARFYSAWVMQGNLALLNDDPAQALSCFETARALEPAHAEIELSLGQACLALRRWTDAIVALNAFLRARPERFHAWKLLAQAYKQVFWSFHQAHALESALALRPDDLDLRENLGLIWFHLGRAEAFGELLEKFLGLSPAGRAWYASLPQAQQELIDARRAGYRAQYLLKLYADPQIDDLQLFAAIAEIQPASSDASAPAFTAQPPLRRAPHRPLRVGYVSREFGLYASMRLCLPLFRHHGPKLALYAYDDTPEPDAASEAIRPLFAHWRSLADLSNAEAAARIRADGIDVLVDLAGLTHASRQGLFALHPAPVQIGGLGFVFSSASSDLDYCFSDAVLAPPAIAASYPETVIHLASAFHWQPLETPIDAGPPPSAQNGFVTFGSASSLNKLNPAVLRLWSQLLQAMPTARLFLKTPMLNDPLTVQYYRELFVHFGADGERLRLEGLTSERHVEYFYSQIDIALDPFPYQGGVTSCEALWMGVPVLSLFAPRWRARALSASILTTLGLSDWLAADEAEYLARALAWAADAAFLRRQRRELRQRLLDSAICDGKAFAKQVEGVYYRLARGDKPKRG